MPSLTVSEYDARGKGLKRRVGDSMRAHPDAVHFVMYGASWCGFCTRYLDTLQRFVDGTNKTAYDTFMHVIKQDDRDTPPFLSKKQARQFSGFPGIFQVAAGAGGVRGRRGNFATVGMVDPAQRDDIAGIVRRAGRALKAVRRAMTGRLVRPRSARKSRAATKRRRAKRGRYRYTRRG